MSTDERFDDAITGWLEQAAPGRLPDRVLAATFERTRLSKQQVGWRARLGRILMARPAFALGGAAAVVMAAALALNFAVVPGVGGPSPSAVPQSPFLGTWFSTSDADGGTQTMTVQILPEGAVEIVVTDDIASVCSRTPSTMTGIGRLEGSTRLVIPEPLYTCDDGSEAEAMSGPPLQEQLRNLTYLHDSRTDVLTVGPGSVWTRDRRPAPSPAPEAARTMWPQSTLDEMREAQERADAGDPGYRWQVDPDLQAKLRRGPYAAEIFDRFIREALGWGGYAGIGTSDFGDFVLIRCASGTTNALYPDDPAGVDCAPTIDELRYETVQVDVTQPVRQDATGIWAVTSWTTVEPFEQVAPPSETEMTTLLEAFLQARIDGQGAQDFVWPSIDGPEIPFLYATPAGTPYERYEFEVADGPRWPGSQTRFKVRLLANDGDTVVEQFFLLERSELGLLYESEAEWGGEPGRPGTTVNGQIVPVPHSLRGGEVTLQVTYPWRGSPLDYGSRIDLTSDEFNASALVLNGPITTGCLEGPAPADVQALAQTIRSSGDIVATVPVTVMVGGLPALRMDVTTAPGAPVMCQPQDEPAAVAGVYIYHEPRARFYLVDLPEGSSSRIFVFAIVADEETFDRAMESISPIVDSIEFRVP